MPHHFTDDEKSKLDEYLAKKAGLKKRRRKLWQELEEVEASIVDIRTKYGAIYNTRNPVLTLPVEVTCLIFTFAQLPKPRIDLFAWGTEDTYEEEEFLMEVVVSVDFSRVSKALDRLPQRGHKNRWRSTASTLRHLCGEICRSSITHLVQLPTRS